MPTALGSSPLTRGKHRGGIRMGAPTGLIPAHAGKTRVLWKHFVNAGAHPRSRGENYYPTGSSVIREGSSPLTRGKRREGRHGLFASGLIPAHAGKTLCGFGCHDRGPAHPRSRGENRPRTGIRAARPGSSPLTRGKPGGRASHLGKVGLIPAHAGKTWTCRGTAWASRAHPRSRGENWAYACNRGNVLGSSPLTRGKHAGWVARLVNGGLIPAHAGKTSCSTITSTGSRAHPRSRGENFSTLVRVRVSKGSSPLTRGKRCLRTER